MTHHPAGPEGTAPIDPGALTLSDGADARDAFTLDGKHVVVTGGGRGIGQAIALAVAAAGATVTVIARSTDQLAQTAAAITGRGGKCHVHPADLSRLAELDVHAAEIWRTAPIYGVVHAAGKQVRKPCVDVSIADWQSIQTVNVAAPFFLSTAIARLQHEEAKGGSHVFIGSLTSSIGLPNVAPYAASKSAILGLARTMSVEWSKRSIRANVVGPGYFATKLTEDLLTDQQQHARVLGRIPMGHLGAPADVGAVAVFLLSSASSYITGQLINVDGGWLGS